MNKLFCEILSMCYRISKHSKADVFFEYAPHCNAYTVFWFRDGWTERTAGDMEYLNCVTHISRVNMKVTLAKLHDIAAEMGVL